MFSFLCILLGTFQFALLLMVTGILLSLAIVSRLMEIVITLIHPTSIFLLRQSVKLFVLITSLSARMTGYVWCKTIRRINSDVPHEDNQEEIEINMTAPEIPYMTTVHPYMDHVYKKPLELNVLNNDQLPSDLANNGQESTIDSKKESTSSSKEDEAA